MTIDLKAIRAAAEAATPGPWETTCNHPGSVMTKGGKPIATCSMQGGLIDMQANVNHIAISNPTAVIALLDRLEAAETEVFEQARLLGIGGEKELGLMAKLEAAEKEIQLVRNAALEEAAQVCDVECDNWDNERPIRLCANLIRIRKS